MALSNDSCPKTERESLTLQGQNEHMAEQRDGGG